MPSGTWGTTHNGETWYGSEAYGLQHNLIIQSHHQIKTIGQSQQIALETISRVQSITNYEGDEVDLGDGDGAGDGADEDGDEDASSHA